VATIAQPLLHDTNVVTDGGLIKQGAGTLTLSGLSTYNGTTTVSGGTLVIAPAAAAAPGDYMISGGSVLRVRGAVAGDVMGVNALTLNSASSLVLDETNMSAPLIVVTNALTTASTTILNLTNMTITAGQYPLIKYGSLNGAGVAGFTLGATPLTPGLALSLVNNPANQSVDLLAVASTPTLTWAGNVSGAWDIGGTPNWQGGAFYNESGGTGPIVEFDDSASGTTAISLNTTVAPTEMVVSNSSLNYSISGTGQIAGTGSLLKKGDGTFILATKSTGSDPVSIQGGTLQLGDGAASNGSVGGSINDNAVLAVANPNSQTMNNLISGSGSLTKSGNGILTLTATNTITGAVAVNAGTLALNAGGNSGNVPVLGNVSTVTVASGAALNLLGANTLGLTNGSALPTVTISGNASLNVIGTGTHAVGSLNLGDFSSGGTMSGPGVVVVNGNLTNASASTVNLASLMCNSTNIFFSGSAALMVNSNLSIIAPGTGQPETVMIGDPNGNGGTLTTKGSVNVNRSYVELDYMTWNVDIGTNTLNIFSKFTLGKIGGLPAYMEWISGNGLIAANNYFTLGDSFIGISGPSQGELDVTGGNLVISNNATRCLVGNAGVGVINVSGGSLSFLGNSSIQVGGYSSYPAAGASGTLTINGNGSVIIGPQSGGLRLAADKRTGTITGITGTINLNGGSLTTWPDIRNGSTDGGGSSYINFNGGILKAGTNTPTFLQGLTTASVQSGGAIIDDGGNIITIGQSLTDGGGEGGLIKLGAGALILTNANTYAGATTVSNGTLEVDGSLAGSQVVVTANGVLSGVGSISSPVTINAGGVLSPGLKIAGTNDMGVLTINNNLTINGSLLFQLNKNWAQSNSMAVVSGVLANSGTGSILITNLGPTLAVGDSFQLFNQPVLNGSALSISSGDGVTWTNMLALNGSIQVLAVTVPINPLPGIVQFHVSGDNLGLSWPTNSGWILQEQNNPLAVGLSNNWVNVPNSGSVTNMNFKLTNAAAFYRLVHP